MSNKKIMKNVLNTSTIYDKNIDTMPNETIINNNDNDNDDSINIDLTENIDDVCDYNLKKEERLLNKVMVLNTQGKPVKINDKGKIIKKVCTYNCEHCLYIESSDESDKDYEEDYYKYKATH